MTSSDDRAEAAASDSAAPSLDFIREIVAADVAAGGAVVTRFPPEPNGYLHIGHAKAICVDFGVAIEYGGACNLRFDDTNPVKEDVEYVESIKADVHWLGFDWAGREFFASDYYERLYLDAEGLIRRGHAFVDSHTADEIRAHRGTLTEPGTDSPYRSRGVDENLDLFRRMRAGEFADGTHVLRAKIDMASPNINLRDPVLYRIRHAEHHRTGNAWCIYPMYDYAHPLSDAYEGVTHSLCTLEYEAHRPLYDWVVREAQAAHVPRQIEFARLNLNYTVMSKRKLLQLVAQNHVSGWDDPRMPTISGLRRRGYTPESIRDFCGRVGVAKKENVIDIGLLEHCVREDLNKRAPRAMAVLKPLKVVLTNYPEGRSEVLALVNNPEDPGAGTRDVPFGRELFIEQDDFMEEPAEEVLPSRARPRSTAAQRLPHHLPGGGARTPTASSSSCAAPTIRRHAAATRPTGARSRPRSTGCRRPMPSTARCGSTIGCSRRRRRKPPPRRPARPSSTCSIPRASRSCAAASWSRCSARRRPARACSSSVWATSRPTPTPPSAPRSSTARSR